MYLTHFIFALNFLCINFQHKFKVRWCRLGDMAEALLCVLQIGSLTIYNISGEFLLLTCT